MKKIVLVFSKPDEPVVANGMDLYRLAQPYTVLEDEYEIHATCFNEFDMEDKLQGDIYVMNRPKLFRAQKVKGQGKTLIVDVDDFWFVPKWHPLNVNILKAQLDFATKHPEKVKMDEVNAVRATYEREKNQANNTLEACRIADYVTTTTETLANELRKVGIEANVILNTIHPNTKMFSVKKLRSNVCRFAWIGGVFHRRDIALMYEGIARLHDNPKYKNTYQILTSFNHTEEHKEIERLLTNGYKCVSEGYKQYLQSYTQIGSHIGNDQPYKRMWGLGVTEYGVMYENVDVALIPLQGGIFNACKSELKLVEAGETGCAAIVSDVLPYSKWLKDGKNCLTAEGTKGWYSGMKKLIDHPDLRKELAYNLNKTIRENFDVETEANKLRTLLK